MPGPLYNATAAQGAFPAAVMTPLQVGDPVTFPAYNAYIATAKDLPVKLQSEIMAIETWLKANAVNLVTLKEKQIIRAGAIAAAGSVSIYNFRNFR